MLSRTISEGWEFSQTASEIIPEVKEDWTTCTKVPTSVHVELIAQKKIPHPYKGLAEWDVQWVQEADWAFRTTFSVSKDELEQPEKDLVFDGLDTYCDIYLNGKHLQHTENMYTQYRISVKDVVKEKNELVLKFKSPHVEARREMNANGGPRSLWNGEPERLFSRKSGYHWGWDWGPVIMCTGPWRPIHFEAYSYRFADIRIDTSLIGPSYNQATLKGTLEVTPRPSPDHKLIATLTAKGKVVKQSVHAVEDQLDWKFETGQVEAWWPIGYGKQPLYDLEVTLVDKSGNELVKSHTRVAFRDAQVVQDELEGQDGTSFLFQINGVRIFCGGSNWIPADNFYTEIEKDRYRRWVEMLVEGNQNMLRVWGGGIYEEEELYDACDELGILVWQDFMFGCGFYPSYDKINQSIKLEAEQAVSRLRNHPSVVIFAGNNEDYQLAEGIPGAIDYSDESGDYLKGPMPARHIYEVLLPEVVDRLSNVFYWRSSPYGGKKSVSDQTVGDIHQWNVWHGTQEPWSNWDKLAGRFVSEFGMQGYPNLRTVKEWDDDEKQLFPQSRVSANHNKADGFERRIELYLAENFRHAYDMPSYVYYTQIMQAECLAAAYRLWRRNWKGRGKEYTAGALVWQINDCWPCVSWAIADYYLRPKPAYFAISRELRPYTVGMARKDIKTPTRENSLAYFEIHQELQLWGCNSTLDLKTVKVELVSFDLDAGEVDRRSFDVELAPNASTEIWKGDVPGQTTRTSSGQVPKPIVCQARLLDGDGKVLARYSNWPEPWKYLLFPDPKLKIQVSGEKVTLSCDKPIKGIVLDVEGEECKWSDQAIDLFPGDEQTIVAKGLNGKVLARYLGDGSA